MNHPFLAAVSNGLAKAGIASLRYQFPYMERGSKRPDTPKIAQATVRAAAGEAARLLPGLPLFAGGKSFGGRMTSQAQAESALTDVRGVFFLGFPLHAPGRPSDERGSHLLDVRLPILFLQGTRDDFADLGLLEPLVKRLGPAATLRLFPEADHSFRVPARTGRKNEEILAEMIEALTAWIDRIAADPAARASR
jgi:predicted alpha/beta-hydrolase family hydrolase